MWRIGRRPRLASKSSTGPRTRATIKHVDRPQGDRTREKLIAAAERLMAERGIDGVDFKDIHVEAGQRNRSAVAYHFTDRAGLVVSIGRN